MTLFGKKGKLILLHKGLETIEPAKLYDLILSPQFYFVKKERVPVKYKFEAIKLAPSILDDLLDDEKSYEFIVLKEGDLWCFYAYDPSEIESFLARFSIKPSQINLIYFADQLSDILIKAPLSLNRRYALMLVDDYATIVPKELIKGNKYLELSQLPRPKKGFKFASTTLNLNQQVDSGSKIVASLIALLGILYFIEGYGYNLELSKIQNSLAKIYEESPALASKIGRDSIKSKYSKLEGRERRLREIIKVLDSIGSKKAILNSLELKGDKLIIANYTFLDKAQLKRAKGIVTANGLKYKERGKTLRIVGEIK